MLQILNRLFCQQDLFMSEKNKLSVAKAKDVDEIMRYIDFEWKKGHILSTNKDLFLFQHKNSEVPRCFQWKGGA
jgi:hypothetical protein